MSTKYTKIAIEAIKVMPVVSRFQNLLSGGTVPLGTAGTVVAVPQGAYAFQVQGTADIGHTYIRAALLKSGESLDWNNASFHPYTYSNPLRAALHEEIGSVAVSYFGIGGTGSASLSGDWFILSDG